MLMKRLVAIAGVALLLSACDNSESLSQKPAQTQEESQRKLDMAVAQEAVDKLYQQSSKDILQDVMANNVRFLESLTKEEFERAEPVSITELHRNRKSGNWSVMVDFVKEDRSLKIPIAELNGYTFDNAQYEVLQDKEGNLYALVEYTP